LKQANFYFVLLFYMAHRSHRSYQLTVKGSSLNSLDPAHAKE